MKSAKIQVSLDEADMHLFKRACRAVGYDEPSVMARKLVLAYNQAFLSSDKSTGFGPTNPPKIAMVASKPVQQFGQWSADNPKKETP